MRLLLDTHIWIWILNPTEKLSRRVQRQIANPQNELYLSPVSIWEAHNVAKRGKLRLRTGFKDWLESAFATLPLQEAPFSLTIAAEACRIRLPQPDLGDIWLAATASVLDLTLVTADRQLIGCSWLKTLPNE